MLILTRGGAFKGICGVELSLRLERLKRWYALVVHDLLHCLVVEGSFGRRTLNTATVKITLH